MGNGAETGWRIVLVVVVIFVVIQLAVAPGRIKHQNIGIHIVEKLIVVVVISELAHLVLRSTVSKLETGEKNQHRLDDVRPDGLEDWVKGSLHHEAAQRMDAQAPIVQALELGDSRKPESKEALCHALYLLKRRNQLGCVDIEGRNQHIEGGNDDAGALIALQKLLSGKANKQTHILGGMLRANEDNDFHDAARMSLRIGTEAVELPDVLQHRANAHDAIAVAEKTLRVVVQKIVQGIADFWKVLDRVAKDAVLDETQDLPHPRRHRLFGAVLEQNQTRLHKIWGIMPFSQPGTFLEGTNRQKAHVKPCRVVVKVAWKKGKMTSSTWAWVWGSLKLFTMRMRVSMILSEAKILDASASLSGSKSSMRCHEATRFEQMAGASCSRSLLYAEITALSVLVRDSSSTWARSSRRRSTMA
eukprot:m.70929 g.70929  ORF g.70929 m.70929 type:complete len:416 (-) comp7906_c0_seq3:1658-2905(-)